MESMLNPIKQAKKKYKKNIFDSMTRCYKETISSSTHNDRKKKTL